MSSCENCKHVNKTALEEPCNHCTHNATDNFEPMTNGDRIRNMTDEELVVLFTTCMSDDCPLPTERCPTVIRPCRECIEEWLKQKVEAGE